ncbi:putative taste receptor type 2 member 33 [Pteronotus mesoamericanus]|uniref:putative taste receptor type 2 member 33 n=1 Tax=Pteronotus mesoamericanus TaxID=1884717 RepID=UPI0023ED76D0|nr:putative taste receptor type 2 member 33 [Pteronotus parnellii mesoamericanus]
MINLIQSILSSLVIAEFVLGNFANVFIALVNGIDWVKKQKISCTDGILTAMAVSRIGLLWVIALNWYAIVFNAALYSSEMRTVVNIAWVVSNHFSLWLATGLSILYLLKIANFSSLFFLHLKWKAERVVVMILLGSLVFLVSHLAVVSLDIKMEMNEFEGNITWMTNLRDIAHLSNMTVFTIIHIIPFTMVLAALLLLLLSLWRHLKNMQLSGKGSQDAGTKVHVRAMQTAVSFLLMFVIYFLALIITVWSFDSLHNEEVFLCGQFFAILYPSNQSFIIIWGNKKLNQNFVSLLWQVRCWPTERKLATPQVNRRGIICILAETK